MGSGTSDVAAAGERIVNPSAGAEDPGASAGYTVVVGFTIRIQRLFNAGVIG